MTGVLNLHKPPAMTSHDVVDVVRRLLKTKRVGHAGTLDPAATGVLVVCVGEATRIVEYLMEGAKSYRAEITFGVTTITEDAEGEVVSEQSAADVTEERLREVLKQFIGDIEQTPPMFSAVQVGGRRLHELARRGETVERPKRQVHVEEITLLKFCKVPHAGLAPSSKLESSDNFSSNSSLEEGASPAERAVALVDVTCSKGTYVRTLAADIGAALGCGAHLSSLIRTRVGQFRLEDSLTLEELQATLEDGTLKLMSLNEALSHLPSVTLGETATKKIRNGQSIPAEGIHHIGDLLRLCAGQGRLIAIAQCVENQKKEIVYQPQKVFKS
jgi:tRNA pseudouridine55 synthase